MESGKRIEMIYNGKAVTILNQRSRLWTHPYDYRTPQKATLSSAGCGVFSICHCGQWLTGKAFSPEELADFSMQNGGRGDDGTDRPALLSAMMQKGLAAQYGFSYQGDGLRNDLETLRVHLLEHRGVALCNLRVGHIVSLLDAREADGERIDGRKDSSACAGNCAAKRGGYAGAKRRGAGCGSATAVCHVLGGYRHCARF